MNIGGIKLGASGIGTVTPPEHTAHIDFPPPVLGEVLSASIIDGNTGEHLGGDPPLDIHIVPPDEK